MMDRQCEHEVLKRHDVYVVRSCATGEYQVFRRYMGHAWWGVGPEEKACEFHFKWRAIFHAKFVERKARREAIEEAKIKKRKEAKEVRVWR